MLQHKMVMIGRAEDQPSWWHLQTVTADDLTACRWDDDLQHRQGNPLQSGFICTDSRQNQTTGCDTLSYTAEYHEHTSWLQPPARSTVTKLPYAQGKAALAACAGP